MNLRRMLAMCLFFVTSSSSLAMKEKKVEEPQCIICLEAIQKNRSHKTSCCGREFCDIHLYKWCLEKGRCPLCREKLDAAPLLNEILKKHPDICRLCFDEQLPKDATKFTIPECEHTFCGGCVIIYNFELGECYCTICNEFRKLPDKLTEWFYRNRTIDVRDLPGMDKMSDDEIVKWLCSLYEDRLDVYIRPHYDPYGEGRELPPNVITHLGILGKDGTVMADFDVLEYTLDSKTKGDEKKFITINDSGLAKKFIEAFNTMKKKEREEREEREEQKEQKEQKDYENWLKLLSYEEPYGPMCNIF